MNKQIEPTIGIITALPKEYAAVRVMLDSGRDYYTRGPKAGRQYFLGQMPAAGGGTHPVALSLAVVTGTNAAAVWAANLLEDFPSVQKIIMVGIAGGVPYPEKPDDHVRLGDVVVLSEEGVVQYDFVKEEIDRIILRHTSHRPDASLLQAARRLEADEISGKREWVKLIDRAKGLRGAQRPPDETDVLYGFTIRENSHSCEEKIVHPSDPKRVPGEPRVFIGPIASSNALQKDPFRRDELREHCDVRAIEMEGSGIDYATWIDEASYLVIRGICDYCDPHKNDEWQGYAAVAAAAYTRGLLEMIPSVTSELVVQKKATSRTDGPILPVPIPLSSSTSQEEVVTTTTPEPAHSSRLPVLALKLFQQHDRTYRKEIPFRQVAGPQTFTFGLALMNLTKRTTAREISIRISIYWDGILPHYAPIFKVPQGSEGWEVYRDKLSYSNPAVLRFSGSQRDRCPSRQPLEWYGFSLSLSEPLMGHFLLSYEVSSANPSTENSGQLKIDLGEERYQEIVSYLEGSGG